LIGHKIWHHYPELIGTSFEDAYRRAMEANEPTTWEDFYPPHQRWYRNHFYPSSDGLIAQSIDVTYQHQGKERLDKTIEPGGSVSDMLEAFDLMRDPVMIIDKDDRFTYVNQAALQVHQRPRSDMIGRRMSDVNPAARQSELAKHLAKARRAGTRQRFEQHVKPPGKWFQVELIPWRQYMIIYTVEITKQKQSEESISILAESLEQASVIGWNRKNARDGKLGRSKPGGT
jgi:PAS domain S-box-containing protein